MKAPFSKVDCSGNELEYVKQVIASGWLTTSKFCMEFERRFGEYLGVKYCCAVNSCTAALHLAMDAAGVQEGAKAFVPTMTFTASAEILRYLHADPVIVDVDYGTSLITPEILEQAIRKNPDVRYLTLVHYAGQAADMDPIMEICHKNGIRIIEDAAHAFPTKYKGRFVGSFDNVVCFSFYANKTMTTGEGGLIATNDENLYKRVKLMRLHGINRTIWDRFTKNAGQWEYDVVAPGYKYNMPDVNAAIGLAQLERVEEFRAARQHIAERYLAELKDVEALDLPKIRCNYDEHSWHIFQVVLNEKSKKTRAEVLEELNKREIGFSVHYRPLHRMTYYKERYNLKPEDFPNAERIWKGNFSLPIFSKMTDEECDYVVCSLKDVLC